MTCTSWFACFLNTKRNMHFMWMGGFPCRRRPPRRGKRAHSPAKGEAWRRHFPRYTLVKAASFRLWATRLGVSSTIVDLGCGKVILDPLRVQTCSIGHPPAPPTPQRRRRAEPRADAGGDAVECLGNRQAGTPNTCEGAWRVEGFLPSPVLNPLRLEGIRGIPYPELSASRKGTRATRRRLFASHPKRDRDLKRGHLERNRRDDHGNAGVQRENAVAHHLRAIRTPSAPHRRGPHKSCGRKQFRSAGHWRGLGLAPSDAGPVNSCGCIWGSSFAVLFARGDGCGKRRRTRQAQAWDDGAPPPRTPYHIEIVWWGGVSPPPVPTTTTTGSRSR